MIRSVIAAMVIAAGAAGTHAQTAEQAAALARIGERGALLYAFDRAAWHATDDLRARHPEVMARLGGYVVDGTAAAPRAIFFDAAGSRAVYVARFEDDRLVEGRLTGSGDDAGLSPSVKRMIAARAAAAAAIAADASARPCAAKPFNTVVVPPSAPDGPVTVYFMTPQVTGDMVPFGGHYAVDVDAAGKAGPVRRFTRTCLDMPTSPGSPAGSRPAAIVVSQIVGALPTEIHVFQSLTLRKPVMVVAGKPAQIWPVAGARFRPPVPIGR